MNQLTNQEKAKVFAMYWGQKISFDFSSRYVEFKQPETRYGIMKGVDGIQLIFHPITRNGLVDRMSSDRFGVASGKLILTPLSRITDEHAIKVCEMVVCPGRNYPASDYRIKRDNAASSVSVKINNDWFEGTVNIGKIHMVVWMPNAFNARVPASVYDFLRSKGYAEESLFELGVAIYKNENGGV